MPQAKLSLESVFVYSKNQPCEICGVPGCDDHRDERLRKAHEKIQQKRRESLHEQAGKVNGWTGQPREDK